VGSILNVLLITVLAIGFHGVSRVLASFTNLDQLANLAAISIGVVAYWAGAIAVWVLLTHLSPKLDSSRWSLVLCFPATVVTLFVVPAFIATPDGPEFTWLALVAPLFLGVLAVAPRLVDPALVHGSFASSQAKPQAAG